MDEDKKTIMVIEDVAYARLMYKQALSMAGYDVIEAQDWQDANIKLKDQYPDLFILDYNLPNTTGIEILEIIRKKDRKIPVLIATAYADKNKVLAAGKIGISGYITKPIDLKMLVEKISYIFELQND